MKHIEALVDALEYVTDRLALHVEYEKYDDFRENVKDKAALNEAESMLYNSRHEMGAKVLLAMTTESELRRVLANVTERLRLHTVNNPYDEGYGVDDDCDVSENDADRAALDDANSVLLNPEVNLE